MKIFPLARLALKYALIKFNFKKGDVVLVPDFNCDAIYHPLKELDIILRYYPISDMLNPIWGELEKMVCSNTKAVMMVHYFGQPQQIEKYKLFCNRYKLLLIEDNSHGYSGKYQSKLLGKFGDIGFSSPRKQLNIYRGAVLYINGEEISTENLNFFSILSSGSVIQLLLVILSRLTVIKLFLKNNFLKKPDYSNPNNFKEQEILNSKIDLYSIVKITRSNWETIAIGRRNYWEKWANFCIDFNMIPLWMKSAENTCPWLMPVYVEDPEIRIKILNAAWESGLGFITWPALPNEVLNSNKHKSAIKRWNKLICIPLNKSPEELVAQIEIFNLCISSNR